MKKWPKIMLFIIFILILIFELLLIYQKILEEKETKIIKENKIPKNISPKKTEPQKLSLIMVGDCLMHSAVYNNGKQSDGTYEYKQMFTQVKPIIQQYDLAFYNQESILGGKEIGLSDYPRFNSPYEIGDAMLDTGFNLVSLANNHALDRGEQALDNSLKYWSNKDVVTAGSYNSFEDRDNIPVYTKNGITYALLAYTTVTNGLQRPVGKEYYLNVYDEDQVKRDIEYIRDKVDLLMVSMHFGTEYTLKQTTEQEKIAQYLASLNVDIVIGHHPHVIEPITYINNTLVIYSLGNFISAQRTVDQLTGLMVGVNIIKEENKIKLTDITAEFTYTKMRNPYNKQFEFEIIPYNNLSEDILPNKDKYKEKYAEVVNSLGANVLIK